MMREVKQSGTTFVVLFVGAFALLGELVGSFADPDRQFTSLFADSGNRAAYIVGAGLLILAGMAFMWFAHALSGEAGRHRAPLLITGGAAASGMVLAALAFAAVPLSLSFGALFGDPGLETGQAVLPQFGYVALSLGGLLPAAIFMMIAARSPGLLPGWLRLGTYPVAILVGLTVVLFMPVLLFVLWVIAATASKWRHSTPVAQV